MPGLYRGPEYIQSLSSRPLILPTHGELGSGGGQGRFINMGGRTGEGTRDRLCPCEDGPRGPPPSVVAPVSVTSAGVVLQWDGPGEFSAEGGGEGEEEGEGEG